MMKTKTLFISCLALLSLNAPALAANGGGKKKAGSSASRSSKSKTTATKKVLTSTVNAAAKATPDSLDPKNGFEDLFLAEMNGSNGAKLNPRTLTFVQDYMDRNTDDLMKLKNWGRPYFNMMDGILTKYGLPVELKYLAVIESQLKSTAVSWAGAVGPWQFMPGTARGYGLNVSRSRDDRRDYVKSTHAAAKYLTNLYKEFGDWLLVIAAYNGGPGVVYNAIKKSGSRNFWNLQYYLPTESRNHVKKFIGTHYIFEGQGGITTLTKAEADAQLGAAAGYILARKLTTSELEAAKTATISGKYFSSIIAKHILMEVTDFNRYNPDFDRLMASAENTYELKLPPAKMELFNANKYQILNESVNLLLSGASTSNGETTYANK